MPEKSGVPAEFQVIAKLANKPKRTKMDVTIDSEYTVTATARCHVSIVYEYNGKLRSLGNYLYKIAEDVWNAGGVVAGFSFGSISPLRPHNEQSEDYDYRGNWQSLFLECKIRVRSEVNAEREKWDAAAAEVLKEFDS